MGKKGPKYVLLDSVVDKPFEERVTWAIWASQLRDLKQAARHVLMYMAAAPGMTQDDIEFGTGIDRRKMAKAIKDLSDASLLKRMY